MRKTNTSENDNKIAVDINGLQSLLSVGRRTAERIGLESGAVIKIGRRTIYNVSKVESYLNQKTEG